MLSDEEKEALEILNNTEWDGFMITIKNLIEKQSKEIEELKQEKEYLNCIIESDNDNYINKDKIKAKIEDILNSENSEAIEKLIEWQSLLEKE